MTPGGKFISQTEAEIDLMPFFSKKPFNYQAFVSSLSRSPHWKSVNLMMNVLAIDLLSQA